MDLGFDLGFGAIDQRDEKLYLYCAYKDVVKYLYFGGDMELFSLEMGSSGGTFCGLSVHKGDLKETWRVFTMSCSDRTRGNERWQI